MTGKESAKEKGAGKAAKAEKKEKSAAKGSQKKAAHGRDPWKVLSFPHLAEKSMNMVEFDNKLTFIVRKKATKNEIRQAVEDLFDVKVIKVQTEITPKGVKKAYAKLSPENSASEIASRLGMV
jgi:large subunit ribosomal protein L23